MRPTHLIPILVAMSACAAPDAQPREAQPFDIEYVAPADRIDPQAARAFSDDQFRALGRARSGVSGVGRAPVAALQRYVSATGGDDANDGSKDAPWRTVQHAADVVEAGTTVWVDDSGPYEDGLVVRRGGRPGAYVVFRNRDEGRAPMIMPNPSRDAVVDIDASYVVLQGFEIANHRRSSLAEDTIGVLIEPRSADIAHVYVVGNYVHDLGPGVLEESSCYYNGHGIIAQSEDHAISNLVIDGNELHDLFVGNSEVLVVNGNVDNFRVTNNYIHDVNNIAIDIIGYEKNDRETTKNGVVADNVVLDASNYWPYCSRGNCTYPAGDESSDGIYVDGGAGIVIEYNVVGRTDHGIELQSENGELIRDVEVRFNVIFNSNYRHFTLGPSEGSFEHDNEMFDAESLADAMLEACKS